jgi:hypothetical protein
MIYFKIFIHFNSVTCGLAIQKILIISSERAENSFFQRKRASSMMISLKKLFLLYEQSLNKFECQYLGYFCCVIFIPF